MLLSIMTDNKEGSRNFFVKSVETHAQESRW